MTMTVLACALAASLVAVLATERTPLWLTLGLGLLFGLVIRAL